MADWGKSWGKYLTPDGIVTMQRRGQRVRFYDEAGHQYGPEHANVVPAVVYALANGWWDDDCPAWLNVGTILEVRRNGHAR